MRILIVQLGKIGDLVVTTSLFRTLKESFGRPIDVMAGGLAPQILKGNDAIGKIFDLSVDPTVLRVEQYTHALILMPSLKAWWLCRKAGIKNLIGAVHPKMNRLLKLCSVLLTKKLVYDYETLAEDFYLGFAKGLGITNLISKREVYFDAHDQKVVEKFLASRGLFGKNLVGICITAGKKFKEWGVNNFARLVHKLNEEGFYVVGVGDGTDFAQLEELKSKLQYPEKFTNAAGRFQLSELAALCLRFKVFIAADTGPLYIADALNVPVVDLVGPCQGQRPTSQNAIIVGECLNPGHAKAYMMNCPSSKSPEFNRCMKEITFAEVWQAFESLKL